MNASEEEIYFSGTCAKRHKSCSGLVTFLIELFELRVGMPGHSSLKLYMRVVRIGANYDCDKELPAKI
jgi:hypothetical protein